MEADEFEARLDAVLVTRPAIEQAKGVLVLARCATPERAYAELRLACELHEVPLNALAAALVQAAGGRVPVDPLLRKVIWQEWRDVLPSRQI